ncbi:MAG: hypothetical protein R3D98_10450 [Candidatus Krumholzibacteriia bacterium]
MARLASAPRRSCASVVLPLVLLTTAGAVAADRDLPETPYVGVLHVALTCSMPPFQSEASVDVEVSGDGTVDFGSATMTYGGSMPLDDECTYERSGSWEIVPLGTYESGPPRHLAVDENVAYHEELTLTCPGYVIEDGSDGNLNGGMAFDIDDAILGGAVVAVVGETGDAIVWTLTLTPQLPVEAASWSRIKARYHR